LKQFGFTQEEIRQVVERTAQATALSGSTAQEATGSIRQFAQALSANFRGAGQEINSLLEQNLRLAQAISQAVGAKSVGQLKEFARQGKISTEVVARALINDIKVAEEFSRVQVTVGQSTVVLRNSLIDLAGAFEDLLSAASGLVRLITGFATRIRELAGVLRDIDAVSTGLKLKFGLLSQAQLDAREQARLFLRQLRAAEPFFKKFTDTFTDIDSYEELRAALERLILTFPKAARIFAQSLGVTRGELLALAAQGKITARDLVLAFNVVGDEVPKKLDDTADSAKSAVNGFDDLKQRVLEQITIQKALIRGGNAESALQKELIKLRKQNKEITTEQVESLRLLFNELERLRNFEATTTVLQGFQDALRDAVITTEELGQAFAGIALGGVDRLASAIADLAASGFRDLESFREAVSRVFIDIGREIIILIIKFAVLQAVQAGLSAGAAPINPRTGGPLRRGQAAFIGEQGTELFVPTQSGNVVPNNQLAGGGIQGGESKVTVVNALDPELVRGFLTSGEGSQVILNVISENSRTVAGIVQSA
jgi:tape measure domain-containing protein